jgi:Zn-dependent protease
MMNITRKLRLDRFSQDRGFWLFVLAILVAYALLQTDLALGILYTLVALLAAITVHEFSHAWTAHRLGDDTAKNVGRITLNPLAHLDPLGSVMMLITTLTGLGIGWGKPVPVATHRLRYGPRVGHGLVSLSGPTSNLLAATVFALITRIILGLWPSAPDPVLDILTYLVLVNIVIALFNLLPVPPLDGFGVAMGVLGLIGRDWASNLATSLERLGRYGWMLVFGVIIVLQLMGLNLLGTLIGAPAFALFGLLMGF